MRGWAEVTAVQTAAALSTKLEGHITLKVLTDNKAGYVLACKAALLFDNPYFIYYVVPAKAQASVFIMHVWKGVLGEGYGKSDIFAKCDGAVIPGNGAWACVQEGRTA